MRGVKRSDWTAASLFSRWAAVGGWALSNSTGRKYPRLTVMFGLPYPDNKWPALEAHLSLYHIRYALARGEQSCRTHSGARRMRPRLNVTIMDGNALRFFASISWECESPRKTAQMATWRALGERSAASRQLSSFAP